MKRATLTAYPTAPAAPPADLTDRLLAGQPSQPATRPATKRTRRQAAAAPPPVSALETALAATETATEALRLAAREAPARYDVALHYRLDALAHHLQQVKEFVANLAAR